jgi:hypothetical protein
LAESATWMASLSETSLCRCESILPASDCHVSCMATACAAPEVYFSHNSCQSILPDFIRKSQGQRWNQRRNFSGQVAGSSNRSQRGGKYCSTALFPRVVRSQTRLGQHLHRATVVDAQIPLPLSQILCQRIRAEGRSPRMVLLLQS